MSNQKEVVEGFRKAMFGNTIYTLDSVQERAARHHLEVVAEKDTRIESQKQEIEKLKGLLKDSRVTLYRAEGAYPDMYEELWEAYKKEHGVE